MKRSGRRAKCPYGIIDAAAAGMLMRDSRLTNAEIAEALGCNAKSLMNRAKYPTLARVRVFIEGQRAAQKGDSRRRAGRRGLAIDDDES